MKLSGKTTLMLLIFCLLGSVLQAKSPTGDKPLFTVVIDAGHGGKDTGCVGRTTKEKDVNLSVAKLLGAKITEKYGNEVKVVYTRQTDRFVELQKRADIANDANGDLFISIHVNSVDRRARNRRTIHGASVYTCGLHKSESNLEVAMRENAAIELEPDFTEAYQGFDPSSSESYIIFELTQSRHMAKSIEFASLAQDRLVKTAGRADKDVRQAGFLVLWATSMPSVLVELDFMCNPTQEAFLASKNGQQKCATALYEAFCSYYDKEKKHLKQDR